MRIGKEPLPTGLMLGASREAAVPSAANTVCDVCADVVRFDRTHGGDYQWASLIIADEEVPLDLTNLANDSVVIGLENRAGRKGPRHLNSSATPKSSSRP